MRHSLPSNRLAGPLVTALLASGAARAGEAPEPAQTVEAPDNQGSADQPWRLRPPEVSGFIQVHFRHAFETGNDGVVDHDDFRVQRVRIGLHGDVSPRVSYVVEIDPRAPEVTGFLRDAFIRLRVIPRHQIRIGQQKTQFGYENLVSSTELFAVNRTEISDNLSRGANLRDVGVGLVGDLKPAKGWRIEDGVTVTNGDGMNTQDDKTEMKNVWGRLGVRYRHKGSWVRLGGSGGTGDFIDPGDDPIDPADDFKIEFRRVGGDLEIDLPWAFASTEFVWGQDTAQGETIHTHGYYVNLVGKTPWPIGPIARVDTLGSDYRRWTFGAYYGLAKDHVRAMINYELREITEDRNGDIGRGDDKLYLWLQAKF